MADARANPVAPARPGHPARALPADVAGLAGEGLVADLCDDLFDDPVLRSAIARASGMRELGPHGLFEQRRLGLRRLEWAPYGLYAPVCADPLKKTPGSPKFSCAPEGGRAGHRQDLVGAQKIQALADFLNLAPRRASRATVHLNPLCLEAGRLAEQAVAQGWRVLPHETHLLDLRPGLEALRRGYHATKRNQIAKPVKVDSRIALASTEADLLPYFEVYARSLQRWGRAGAWPYPRQLFLDLLRSPTARIWTHHVQGRLACAVVILECRHQALYWQGVSHIEPDQKPAHPMVRLMDAVIQDLCARGVPVLNLGASEGLPEVRRFKEEFGACPVAYSTLQWESAAWRWLQGLRAGRFRNG